MRSHGLRTALKNLKFELQIAWKHRIGVKQARRWNGRTDLKLHLGCGPKIKPGWVNVDVNPKADLTLDLREPLPFADASCEMIYSEHFIEHNDYPEPVTSMLREFHRVMKPGARLRIVVPDNELVLRAYVNGGSEEYYAAQRKWNPAWCTTQMEHVNYAFRQDHEHCFAYDFETMKLLLERCGFAGIQRGTIDMTLDSPDREVGSLYVECVKPPAG